MASLWISAPNTIPDSNYTVGCCWPWEVLHFQCSKIPQFLLRVQRKLRLPLHRTLGKKLWFHDFDICRYATLSLFRGRSKWAWTGNVIGNLAPTLRRSRWKVLERKNLEIKSRKSIELAEKVDWKACPWPQMTTSMKVRIHCSFTGATMARICSRRLSLTFVGAALGSGHEFAVIHPSELGDFKAMPSKSSGLNFGPASVRSHALVSARCSFQCASMLTHSSRLELVSNG